MNVLQGAHRRVPRRSSIAAVAAATAVAVVAGIAIWYSVKPADAATVQPGAFTGYGFDACTAPSSAAMKAWKASSPYGAAGIYIGGVNRGCTQPNLTADWVNEQQAAGWHLFPIYVGLQASCYPSTTRQKIDDTIAAQQGRNSGIDAVNQAVKLGLARNSMLIYDMEAYDNTNAACVAGVLAFMSGWTIALHELGYASGYYSSMGSGVADMVTNYTKVGYVRPDYVDFARWDSVVTVNDPGIPAGYWTPRRRMKQYKGDHKETWGGVEINIDNDYLDLAPLAPTAMADFGGNGFSDVLARNTATGELNLYPGHGSTLEPARVVGSGWNTMNAIIRIGDLNRDGHEDLITRQSSTGYLFFYPGTGSGFGTKKQVGNGWNGMRELTAIGDYTRDGIPDLLAVQSSTGLLYVYPGRATVGFGAKIQVGSGWGAMTELAGVGDFDRNGRPDFVGRPSTGVLMFYGGRTTGFSGRQLGTGWNDRRDLVGVGDFDRDGFPDLAAVTKADNVLRLYRGNGTAFSGSVAIATGFTSRSPLL
jgi:hypothetical protein